MALKLAEESQLGKIHAIRSRQLSTSHHSTIVVKHLSNQSIHFNNQNIVEETDERGSNMDFDARTSRAFCFTECPQGGNQIVPTFYVYTIRCQKKR